MIRKHRRFLFANLLRNMACDVERGENGSVKRRLQMGKINYPEYEDDLDTIYQHLFKKKKKRFSKGQNLEPMADLL